MKNQNDLIFSIVAAVIAIGCAIGFVATAPKPIELPAPSPVPTAPVTVAEGAVVYADSLPGGSSNNLGGGGVAGRRAGGSRAALGGPSGGPQGRGSSVGAPVGAGSMPAGQPQR